jgi:uncharacterized 2Fe-2S/4Fe-4S cluster protein (DUF4445 family)
VPGAVTEVSFRGGRLEYTTVKNEEPIGICASGIVHLTATLLELGVLDSSGLMCRPEEAGHLAPPLRERLVEIEPDLVAFFLDEGVYFTQDDVREVQNAKAALRTAIDQILDAQDLRGVRELVIAGAFGSHLDPGVLEAIGMVPTGRFETIRFAGNTSRKGCEQLLCHSNLRSHLETAVSNLEYLSLADSPEFMERFIENMAFPEIVPRRPAKVVSVTRVNGTRQARGGVERKLWVAQHQDVS